MDKDIVLTGIVLKDQSVGEYDKRISLLTLERGRISAFLRGAKRGKGSPLGNVGPFSFGKFHLFSGSSSYTLRQAEISERFNGVQNDLSNIAYGLYFLEVAEYYSRENADEVERLKLIYQSLRAISSDKFKREFVRLIYELKNIAIIGEYPNIFQCGRCQNKADIHLFSFDKRRIYCDECGKDMEGLERISSSAVYALWYIFNTPAEKIYSFELSDSCFDELRKFTDKYKELYFQHSFKTYDMLDMLVSD